MTKEILYFVRHLILLQGIELIWHLKMERNVKTDSGNVQQTCKPCSITADEFHLSHRLTEVLQKFLSNCVICICFQSSKTSSLNVRVSHICTPDRHTLMCCTDYRFFRHSPSPPHPALSSFLGVVANLLRPAHPPVPITTPFCGKLKTKNSSKEGIPLSVFPCQPPLKEKL